MSLVYVREGTACGEQCHFKLSVIEPFHEKTNVMDSDQPKYSAKADTFSHPVEFLFQESLLNTSIPLRRNVSARISQRGLHLKQTTFENNVAKDEVTHRDVL